MIRAPLGNSAYWDDRICRFDNELSQDAATRNAKLNWPYEPQFWFDHARFAVRVMLLRYSRGDGIEQLAPYVPDLLQAWEQSNRLTVEIPFQHGIQVQRDWTFDLSDLNHYNWCFWVVGLALALQIQDDQWDRLLTLVDGGGRDVLLDRVIATRDPGRSIGTELLHPKPYARLLKAIDAPKDQQAELLRDFVDHWYPELARKGKDELWWYVYGDPVKHPLEMGSYFGRWCIEAVAAVKAFGLDDSLCLGHEHYPGDLLRPHGPTTHPAPEESRSSWWARLIGRK